MKIFISSSAQDRSFAQAIATALRAVGFEPSYDEAALQPGDNIIEAISRRRRSSDAVLVLLSERYFTSALTQQELSTWQLREAAGADATAKSTVIPVRLDDTELPLFLASRQIIDVRGRTPKNAAQVITTALQAWSQTTQTPVSRSERALAVEALRAALATGQLSLVSGAGSSIAAGVASWENVLRQLLTTVFQVSRNTSASDNPEVLAAQYQRLFGTSPLIVAQYLKNALGRDYLESLRTELYRGNPQGSRLLDAIVELCRPQRARSALASIITFNFDDLLEHNLGRNRVQCQPVFSEGQVPRPEALPIYHVHGYIPRTGDLADHHVVFSEDAYHSHFIDPYSWSNLVQLNHYGGATCLFLGLSMTDPNLRRLLDVSRRKAPDGPLRHYAIKRRYSTADFVSEIGDPRAREVLTRMAHVLEEADLRNLGVNIIWVDSFAEIPGILEDVAR